MQSSRPVGRKNLLLNEIIINVDEVLENNTKQAALLKLKESCKFVSYYPNQLKKVNSCMYTCQILGQRDSKLD